MEAHCSIVTHPWFFESCERVEGTSSPPNWIGSMRCGVLSRSDAAPAFPLPASLLCRTATTSSHHILCLRQLLQDCICSSQPPIDLGHRLRARTLWAAVALAAARHPRPRCHPAGPQRWLLHCRVPCARVAAHSPAAAPAQVNAWRPPRPLQARSLCGIQRAKQQLVRTGLPGGMMPM